MAPIHAPKSHLKRIFFSFISFLKFGFAYAACVQRDVSIGKDMDALRIGIESPLDVWAAQGKWNKGLAARHLR